MRKSTRRQIAPEARPAEARAIQVNCGQASDVFGRVGTNKRWAATTHPKVKPILSQNSPSKIGPETDAWSDDFAPESPPPSLMDNPFDISITLDDFKRGKLSNATTEASKSSSKNSPQAMNMLPENTREAFAFLSGGNTSTSTIFQDPQHSITIVLTTPEEEIPEPIYQESPSKIDSRTSSISVASFPTMPSQRTQPSNPSFLMPPTDPQNNRRNRKQAQEACEIRKWLVSFLNAKGDQFPRKLRCRMMHIYSIEDSDLAPEIVARFNAEPDEGVTIENLETDEEMDDRESLRILSQAMRSRTEEQTPMRRTSSLPDTPPSPQKDNRKPSLPRPRTSNSNVLVTIRDEEELDLSPTRVAVISSSKPASETSVAANDHALRKAASVPELKPRRRMSLVKSQSSGAVPRTLKVRDAEGKVRAKRGSILRGVFGTVKEALSVKPR